MPKYIELIYGNAAKWAAIDPEESGTIMGEYFAYTQALAEAGALVAGDPLHGVDTAKTVSAGGAVTDGPFADLTEHLGGYYIIEVATLDEALGWAAKLPGVDRGLDRVEVREVVDVAAMQAAHAAAG